MSDVSRRNFLRLGVCVVGGTCAAHALPAPAQTAEAHDLSTLKTTLPYPRIKLAALDQLKVGIEQTAAYPDQASPIVLLKLGRPAINGIGPGQDIVAFSRRCSHMGGTLAFRAEAGILHCPLHYAMFDAQKGGLMVIGQATDNLPQIELEIDARGDIYAVGVQGLLYGRQANVLA